MQVERIQPLLKMCQTDYEMPTHAKTAHNLQRAHLPVVVCCEFVPALTLLAPPLEAPLVDAFFLVGPPKLKNLKTKGIPEM
jgi:hypothetical protein